MTRSLQPDGPTVCFKEAADAPDVSEEKEVQTDEEPLILCRQCRQVITRPADKISVNGAHQHVFANPHGMVYEIGCFRNVVGCAHAGAWSTEFTWFPGYAWRTLICSGCLSHLGWTFSSNSGDYFYGLILEHLIFPP